MTQEEFNQMFLEAMSQYGAALDSTSADGDAPLTTNETEVVNSNVLLVYAPGGTPQSYKQTTAAVLAAVVAGILEAGAEVMYAVYNSTTFASVSEAYTAGKHIACKNGTQVLMLIGATDTAFTFAVIDGNRTITIATLANDNTWTTSTQTVMQEITQAQFNEIFD